MDAYVNSVATYLFAQSWQIALLACIVGLISLALRNRSAHVRYLLWLIVLAKCLVPPIYSVPVAILPERSPVERLPHPVLQETLVDDSVVTDAGASVTVEKVLIPRELKPAVANTKEIIVFMWLVGAFLFLLWVGGRAVRYTLWLRCQRMPLPPDLKQASQKLFVSLKLKKSPRIWLTRDIGQPFVWGLFRGSVYLPEDFVASDGAQRCRTILAHELSHIARFDAGVNFLQVLAQTIYWFHPFVWWMNREIRVEREKCCDEMAVARLSMAPEHYTSAVVESLARERRPAHTIPSLAIVGSVRDIEERIKTMMRPGKKFYKRPSLIAATIVLLLAVLTVPTAIVLTARAEEKTSIQKEDAVKAAEDKKALEWAKKLLARGTDVNTRDTWGYTFLHHASMNGYKEASELLIANGADVNAKSVIGITPLHAAAGRGHTNIVELLIAKKADVNAKDNQSATPLWYAKNGVVFSFSVTGKLNKQATAQWNAENPGCKEIAEILSKQGAKEQAPVVSLHEAARDGLIEQAKSLISKGVDVNAMDERLAATPLHLAVYFANTEVVELLIANGANVNAKNKWSRTPLHIAIDKGYTNYVELLRKHGAKVDISLGATKTTPAESLLDSATSKYAIPEKNLEIAEQMQSCAANLRKIHASIKKYEKDKGMLPYYLSDLIPGYANKETFFCPYNPKATVKWPYDPKLTCGYVYEFSPFRGRARFGGGPFDGMTWRDRKAAQIRLFGDVVPLVRCRQHSRMALNLAVGGEVYLSGPQWESVIIPDYKVGSELLEESLR